MSHPSPSDAKPAKVRLPNSVHLTQKDMVAAIAFYRDRLGFQLDECWPDDKHPMFGSLSLDGQVVMLGGAIDTSMSDHCTDADALKVYARQADDWKKNKAGVGVAYYLMVPDVDAFHATLATRGVTPLTKPTSQFYGIRDFIVEDPTGHHLVFYSPIQMTSCQSCGMPLADAKPGEMYCKYCTDDQGRLKPYEAVLEGTIQGYFMGMKKMPRTEAEQAAKELLLTMPAWVTRK